MTNSISNLIEFWKLVRHRMAWLSFLHERLGLDAKDEAYLNDLEDAYTQTMKDREKQWCEDVRSRVADFVTEVRQEEPEWAKERRREYLETEIQNMSLEIEGIYREYATLAAEDKPERTLRLKCSGIQGIEKRRNRFAWELRSLSGQTQSDRLEPYQIEKARSFPLEKLVEPVKGYIHCPLHDDTKPSMWVKNGFGHCFSCGGNLDAIGYMTKVRGLSFRQAVEALQ